MYRVLAATDGTIITINGVVQTPLNRTEYRDYEVSAGQYAFIESNHPVSVAQFGFSQDCFGSASNVGDPYILLLNPVENQIADITFSPFPSDVIEAHYVAILVNKENKALTKLVDKATGNTIPLNNFTDMSDYSYVVVAIPPITHSINNAKGFIAFAFGYGSMESYAYSVGARFNTMSPPNLQLDTAYCMREIPVQFPDSLGNGNYKWYTSMNEDEVATTTIPIISTAVSGTYNYFISQIEGCSESPRTKIEIIVHPLPKITFGTDLSRVCNTPYPFEMILPTVGTYTCPIGCTGGQFFPREAGPGSHKITYTYKDENACMSSVDTTITVLSIVENPKIEAIGATAFCDGDSVVLEAIASTITDAFYFQWLHNGNIIVGATTNSYTVKLSGDYTLAIQSKDKCASDSASNPVVVFVRKNPLIPTIYSSPAPPYYYGVDYRLNLSPTENGVRYRWYKDGVFIGEFGINHFLPVLEDRDSGIYYVEAINEYCTAYSPDFNLSPIVMPELFIPNVFTPNGDGINDNFYILGLVAFPKNKLTVVNKRGKLVYSKKYYDNSWDGGDQPDDIYYYYFVTVSLDGVTTTHRGYVYIKRTK